MPAQLATLRGQENTEVDKMPLLPGPPHSDWFGRFDFKLRSQQWPGASAAIPPALGILGRIWNVLGELGHCCKCGRSLLYLVEIWI